MNIFDGHALSQARQDERRRESRAFNNWNAPKDFGIRNYVFVLSHKNYGLYRTRTDDRSLKRGMLYQLS